MTEIIQFLRQFLVGARPWIVVLEWQRAVRVRGGRAVSALAPGIHLKIPLLDSVFTNGTRYRICSLRSQTLTTCDGITIALSGAAGYSIEDISKLYRALDHAEATIEIMARGEIARYVQANPFVTCGPQAICSAVALQLEPYFLKYGLSKPNVTITNFAKTRTLRLIGDNEWGTHGDALSTQ